MTEIVEEIIDPNFRSGTGAKGAWTLAKVKTDKGNEASAFMPIAVGDEVELEYNTQYKSYSAKKPRIQTNAPIAQNEQLDRIEKKLDKLLGNQAYTNDAEIIDNSKEEKFDVEIPF